MNTSYTPVTPNTQEAEAGGWQVPAKPHLKNKPTQVFLFCTILLHFLIVGW
jgi:hypothetical protein